MSFKVLGPLLSWTGMFAIGIMIKYFAFKNNTVWYDIAPEVTLWATGVLFTISVADIALSQAKILPKYTKKTVGIGYEIDYEVTLPDSYEPSAHSKYFYLFLLGLFAWISNILISGSIVANLPATSPAGSQNPQQTMSSFDVGFFLLLVLSTIIASGMVLTALRALREISK